MKGKYKTKVIADESQVPQGYKRLSDLAEIHGDTESRKLSHAQYQGRVRAVKMMRTVDDVRGPVWVYEPDAIRFYQEENPKQNVKSPVAPSEVALLGGLQELMTESIKLQTATLETLLRIEQLWNGGKS